MKKKSAQKVKSSPSNSKKNKAVSAPSKRPASKPAKAVKAFVPKVDPAFAQAVQNYEAGVKALQQHKFDKAKSILEKTASGPNRELAERARLHLRICEQQMARISTSFKSPEEHYDYAVSLMNGGDLEGARQHFEKILKQSPKAEHVQYGLAVLHCLSGRTEESLHHLKKAIELKAANRFQARNDADFQKMSDDPRFTELVYPENIE